MVVIDVADGWWAWVYKYTNKQFWQSTGFSGTRKSTTTQKSIILTFS